MSLFQQKSISLLLVFGLLWHATAFAQAPLTQTVHLKKKPSPAFSQAQTQKLAHADDGNVEFTSSIVANHIEQTSHPESAHHSVLSDSLWVNLALSMAYQRDPEIQKIVKKNHRLASIGTLSAFTLSGMGLSSSILSLSTLNANGHSAQGNDHSTERDNPTASVIGVAGSALSLAVLSGQLFFRRRYRKKMEARQHYIKEQVEYGIAHIETEEGIQILSEMIGAQAAHELEAVLTD